MRQGPMPEIRTLALSGVRAGGTDAMRSTRVLLADDHALVRSGLRLLLSATPDIEVVGEAGDGHEALRLARDLSPDVLLLDISMPGLNGLEVAARVATDHPRTRVLVLSMHRSESYVHQALKAGAAGYLCKDAGQEELELAVRSVARGQMYVCPSASRAAAVALGGYAGELDEPVERLSPRQREILQLIAEGHGTRDVAERLHLSIKTVETHRAAIMKRLGIRDVPGLVRFAIRTGMVSVES